MYLEGDDGCWYGYGFAGGREKDEERTTSLFCSLSLTISTHLYNKLNKLAYSL
jgi:hypothetical protein